MEQFQQEADYDNNVMMNGEFAALAVELPPGLPKVPICNVDMAPPPHIPFSGGAPVPTTPSYQHRGPKKQHNGTPMRKSFGTPSNNGTPRNMGQNNGMFHRTPRNTPQHQRTHRFDLVSPQAESSVSVPIRGIRNENGIVKYPLLLCSQEGTMMLSLAAGVLIEICVDRSFRLVCNDDYMAYVSNGGSVSSVLHKFAKIVHSKEHVHCKFVHANDRLAVVGPEGILFAMDNLSEAYLVSNTTGTGNEHSAFAMAKPEFPIQNIDYTLHQMYSWSDIGNKNISKCNQIVQNASYERKPDGSLNISINGMYIKSNSETGEVTIDAKPVKMTINSKTLSIHLRSPFVDLAIQDRDKCYVKRADKRIHTSRSGMVVSDGTCAISIDQYGRILSCS